MLVEYSRGQNLEHIYSFNFSIVQSAVLDTGITCYLMNIVISIKVYLSVTIGSCVSLKLLLNEEKAGGFWCRFLLVII